MRVKRNPIEEKEFEKTIAFLVDCVRKSSHNSKPVIIHSIRVGLKLFENNQSKEVVIAGFLHDLIEDTSCSFKEIEENFGKKITGLVKKCTVSPKLLKSLRSESTANYKKSWEKETEEALKYSKDILIIKIADANDNANYVGLIENPEHKKKIIWKHRMLIDSLKPLIGQNEIFKEFERKVKSYR